MDGLEKSIICSSLIDMMFHNYGHKELNSSGQLVRKRIAKFMRHRGKVNHKLTVSVINKCDLAWRKTISNFLKQNMKIEAKSTIAAIYNYFPNEIKKFTKVTDEHIEKFMIVSVDDYEAEKNSSVVVDFLMKELGFEKKKSLFAGKKLTLKNNLIIEGKQVREGF